MKSPVDKLLKKHKSLIHSDFRKVVSHVQRKDSEWILNTLMIDGCDVPFKYRRKRIYRNLSGQRVNLTYYADQEEVAGIAIAVMKVVRIRIS